jgi:two-component system NtrC family sensor kinase
MRLRTKLIIWLVATLVVVMFVHGYWSVQQDRENFVREMRVGMTGLSRSIQAALLYLVAEKRDVNATQNFIDSIGRSGNIHGIVVYDPQGKQIAVSASLTNRQSNPDLDPTSILAIDPSPVLASGKSVDGDIESKQHPVYYRIEPILDSENRLQGAFVLGRRGLGYNLTLAARRNRIILTTLILIAVLAVVILLLVQRNFSRPIERLIERIRTIGQGQWDQRIEVDSTNEIGSLAFEFNRMCERLQDAYAKLLLEQQERLNLERSLRQSDRLASVGQLAAGLAHEIGTPLNIIGGRAEFLLRRPRGPEEVDDNLQIIRSQIDRIAGIVRQLLAASRPREPAFRSVELAPLVEKVMGLLEHKIAEKNVSVNLKIEKALPFISADPDQLQQVFLNLFLNSLHALPPGGRISIDAAVTNSESDNGAKPQVRIEFEDNGAGIPAEHVSQVFDPFFTTKDIGEGTGLGLSVSYGIVKDHGGEIRVESQPGQFTRFTILLPMQNHDAVSETRMAIR